jgi:hypothetical protein
LRSNERLRPGATARNFQKATVSLTVSDTQQVYRAESWLTTPWIAWGPKWLVAGPVYTILIFENETEDPPKMHTWSVDAPFDSKGAGLPLPVVVAVPVTTTPGPVVAGLFAGQTEVS